MKEFNRDDEEIIGYTSEQKPLEIVRPYPEDWDHPHVADSNKGVEEQFRSHPLTPQCFRYPTGIEVESSADLGL